MKFSNFALVAVLSCTVLVGNAYGQALRQPQSVQPTALSYDYYYQDGQESPSDVPAVAGDAGCAAASCGLDGGCDSGCNSCCDPCTPWRLFPEFGPCSRWSLTGWVNAGVTANEHNTPSRYNGPVTFNDRREGQLNQLYAILERAGDNGGCGWDWGLRVDLLYGTDYIFTQATGLETRRNGTPKWNSGIHYGLAMPQAYVDVLYNDVSVKLGHFYTIIGYEGVMAPSNFFYSHAYTHQYGEPFTHTGGLAEWQYSDRVVLWGGIVNGWDRFDATTNRAAFLGGFRYTPCHERYSFTATLIAGDEPNNVNVQSNRTMYSLVFNYHVTDNLEYVLQHDNGWQDSFFAGGADAEWYGINQYLFYTMNDCWKAGLRFEWFRDDDGVRVATVRDGGAAFGGAAGNYYQLTGGLNWSPRANVMVRPEVRWDWYDGGTGLPYNDGASDSQVTAAVDVILLF